jgi:hypothetical protein
MPDFHVNIQGSFTCLNLGRGTNGFTSLPKEVVLRIFFALKNPTASALFEPAADSYEVRLAFILVSFVLICRYDLTYFFFHFLCHLFDLFVVWLRLIGLHLILLRGSLNLFLDPLKSSTQPLEHRSRCHVCYFWIFWTTNTNYSHSMHSMYLHQSDCEFPLVEHSSTVQITSLTARHRQLDFRIWCLSLRTTANGGKNYDTILCNTRDPLAWKLMTDPHRKFARNLRDL